MDELSELVERTRAGDGEAYGVLYDRTFDMVYRYAFFRAGRQDLAEQITAQTYRRALLDLDQLACHNLTSLAISFIMISRTVLDEYRRCPAAEPATTGLPPGPEPTDPPPDAAEPGRYPDDARRLAGLLRFLTADQQECLTLRFLLGWSVDQTAAVMGRNAKAVRQLQWRAVRALNRLQLG